MPPFDLFSIGHSNIPAARFAAMLQDAAVTAVADVRSVPNSRWFPWFSQKALAAQLNGIGIAYTAMGDTLGGRPRDDSLYRDGVADYEAMAKQPEFRDRPRPTAGDHRALARLPDVRGTRAARLPPLFTGGAPSRRARASPSATSCMTAPSSRMRRPSSGCWRSTATPATCSLLDRTNDSRQRIVAGRAPWHFGRKFPRGAPARRVECAFRSPCWLLCCSRLPLRRWRRIRARSTKRRCRRLLHPDSPSTPAKELFARKTEPVPLAARSIGFYSSGCLAGAVALPINGPTWQVMRLSRNRNWGHPKLIAFLERLAENAKKVGWNGLLVGDMSQPRGGPMLTGHASHQVGLDADIWLTPMPARKLSAEEREFMSATNMVREDRLDVDPKVWTHQHTELIRTAAEDPDVERIFVNAAIKKALCREAGADRAWLAKVRPWWGHDYHFHVRMFCPPDSPQCKPQPEPPPGEGCGHDLDFWFSPGVLHPAPPTEPPKPRPALTMANLPAACRQVLMAP